MSRDFNVNKKTEFNKKEWRQRKYSNKHKVEKWEERRRKAALHNYRKELRKMEGCTQGTGNPSISSSEGNKQRAPRLSAYQEAQKQCKSKMEEKTARQLEAERKQQERKEALSRYRANKAEAFKKLSRKTKRGQPIMKGRMELLLHKLQRELNP